MDQRADHGVRDIIEIIKQQKKEFDRTQELRITNGAKYGGAQEITQQKMRDEVPVFAGMT